ncbi:T9SS type A sorting domain-containing protein [Flavobacterium sp. DGU11]|uniref:T9SS type A sorting domain-containing protein n=1 Tax=Flavobacterium arundinis TaxID=3139143 RepID=A0ABU9HTG8_9FLAO
MKKTLLLLSLLLAGIMQAQIVNIPDANFKNHLLSVQFTPASEPIDTNGDGELQVSEALAVQHLSIFEHPEITGPISSLEGIGAFTNLTYLSISTSVSSIDLSGLDQVTYLSINDGQMSQLNMSGMDSLTDLFLEMTTLASLDVSNLQSLERLSVDSLYNAGLFSLTIGENPNFKGIWIFSDIIEELDLSGCPNLEFLNVQFNSENHDVFVNLKNGNPVHALNSSAIRDSDYNDNNQYKMFVCVDEGELEYIQFIESNALVSTYCTFTPGGDYNVITGSLLFDNEGDGCDTNDSVISSIKLNINDGTESGSVISNVGLYNFYTQAGTFTITPDFDNEMFTITPPFAEVSFTAVDSLVSTQNFCLTPNGNHPDLDIVIVPFGTRPGFDANYKIVYRNKGNQMLSGSVVLAYQEDVLDFVSANPSEDSSSSGTINWNYNNLAPFEQREIYVILNVNGPMEIPAVNVDDNLQFTATINPVTGDDTLLDNVFGLKETVIGSFDPNDINCLEGNSVNPDKIGEYLHYNINFENTGTAPATFIVVKDVIDTAQFDMATLQLINASHPVQAKVTGNKVEFRFDAINLGPAEKGNVVFKIKTLNTLQANDDVTQQADIFFDYNWPIATNDATTIFEVLSRGDFEKDNSVKVYPNPSNGIVNISAASVIKSVELYDIQGRLLQAGSNASLDISGRALGMYFVKVLTGDGMKVEKLVKK